MACYLIDIDNTILLHGKPIPGAIERVNALFESGHQVWLFSCWPSTEQTQTLLTGLGLRFHGMLPKPFDEEGYHWIDDKALSYATSLVNETPLLRNETPIFRNKTPLSGNETPLSVNGAPPVDRTWYREPHTEIVVHLCRKLAARSYLEIGVHTGATFNRVECPRKVGVDVVNPAGLLDLKVMPSDEFWDTSRETFDLIFIDGLHTYSQSWKDLVGALGHLNPGGVIVLDDCNPTSEEMADPRVPEGDGAWCGRVCDTINRARLSRGLDVTTVDYGVGIGIVRRNGENLELLEEDEMLSYEEFDRSRAEVLNLKPRWWFWDMAAMLSLERSMSVPSMWPGEEIWK